MEESRGHGGANDSAAVKHDMEVGAGWGPSSAFSWLYECVCSGGTRYKDNV